MFLIAKKYLATFEWEKLNIFVVRLPGTFEHELICAQAPMKDNGLRHGHTWVGFGAKHMSGWTHMGGGQPLEICSP